jgi:chromate transport protein ChrA
MIIVSIIAATFHPILLEAIGFCELAGFVVLTIFIYKLAEKSCKNDPRPAIIVIRAISIFLLINGLSNAFGI